MRVEKKLFIYYVISIWIDRIIVVSFITWYVSLYSVILELFGDLGVYFFVLVIIFLLISYFFSDRIFKYQSFGKKIMRIKLTTENGLRVSLSNLLKRRIFEFYVYCSLINREIPNKDPIFLSTFTIIQWYKTEIKNKPRR